MTAHAEYRYPLVGSLVLVAGMALVVVAQVRRAADDGVRAQRVRAAADVAAALGAASEAAKNTVNATTEDQAQLYAGKARAAQALVEQHAGELAGLLTAGSTEQRQLAGFQGCFEALRRVDDELLALAGRNTNLKAYQLAYGPAAAAIVELDEALGRLARRQRGTPHALDVLEASTEARTSVLRVALLLPPHIAEGASERMDALEAQMAVEERAARHGLAVLGAMPTLAGDADLARASQAWARLVELKATILKLSRENTNVRSFTLALDVRRQEEARCQDALAALRDSLQAAQAPAGPGTPRTYPR